MALSHKVAKKAIFLPKRNGLCYSQRIMRRFLVWILLVACWIQAAAFATEFKLTTGDVVKGELADVNSDGMVVRLELGGFSDRISWGRLTQESLRVLADDPKAAKYVKPFIEEAPAEKKQRVKKKPPVIKEPSRLDRPSPNQKFFTGLATPAGFGVLAIFYLANLYAAFHIAKFKGRPPALVIGVSVLFPVVGPLIFLLIPGTEAVASPAAEQPAAASEAVSAETKVAGMQSSLGLAAHQKPTKPGEGAAAQSFKRADVTFDRRFFETKFTGYFRVVPDNPDMVLVVRTAKAEIVGRRISRISGSEVHLQTLQGKEVGIPLGEISEVLTRHKDAK